LKLQTAENAKVGPSLKPFRSMPPDMFTELEKRGITLEQLRGARFHSVIHQQAHPPFAVGVRIPLSPPLFTRPQ
jgi:hypothetical protein